ncbi:MAG TPA: hypothetical protein VHZ24_00635 [Pirellulales bacterium]|nr:hypothetical protein [Pirellulales bacterium]
MSIEVELKINVAALDAPHRHALEEVIGRRLATNQQLIICIKDVKPPPAAAFRPVQTLDDWTNVYEGLTDDEVGAIDKIATTRANLTRELD